MGECCAARRERPLSSSKCECESLCLYWTTINVNWQCHWLGKFTKTFLAHLHLIRGFPLLLSLGQLCTLGLLVYTLFLSARFATYNSCFAVTDSLIKNIFQSHALLPDHMPTKARMIISFGVQLMLQSTLVISDPSPVLTSSQQGGTKNFPITPLHLNILTNGGRGAYTFFRGTTHTASLIKNQTWSYEEAQNHKTTLNQSL